jgi:hypothetical protein
MENMLASTLQHCKFYCIVMVVVWTGDQAQCTAEEDIMMWQAVQE